MAEVILHYCGIRTRLQGSGNFYYTMYNLDKTKNFSATALVMSDTPGREPDKLVNFKGQRVLVRGEVTAIDEYFTINRIILFAKPVGSQYPSGT